MSDLWSTLSGPWRACLEEAWAAYCAGSIPVGAAVTDHDGTVLTRARNRTFERDGDCASFQVNPLAHAEVAALGVLDHGRVDPHTCILYSSQEPCPLCLGALYMSGVREVHFAGRDPYAGSIDLLGATPYLSRKPIRVFPPCSPVLEAVVSGITVEFTLRHGLRGDVPAWVARWREVMPLAVRLGEAAFASGWLQAMRDAGEPAAAVINGLAAQVGEG